MKNILIHGLGQNETSWGNVKTDLEKDFENVICPNLFKIIDNNTYTYENLYNSFSKFCNTFDEKVNICGLSLGGILAVNYAIEFPDKVNSIILIGTPYKMPKILLKMQNIIFKFMPKSMFKNMGCSKNNFMQLTNSLQNIQYSNRLDKIKCDALILCGEKDKANMKSAELLNKNIVNSKMKVIANAGHIVNEEEPKELATIIKEFWKEVNCGKITT